MPVTMHLRPSAAYLALAVAFLLAAFFACGATSSPLAARRQALDLCNFTIALKPPCTSATGGRLAKEDPFYALMATLARLRRVRLRRASAMSQRVLKPYEFCPCRAYMSAAYSASDIVVALDLDQASLVGSILFIIIANDASHSIVGT